MNWVGRVSPSSVKDNIGLNFATILESKSGLGEPLKLAVILDLDLSINDHLTSPDICKRIQEPQESGRQKKGCAMNRPK